MVTGCARARGIGRAIAVAFARAGADVVATDVASGGTRNENEEGLEELRLGWKGLESLAGEADMLSLWAGQAVKLARTGDAGEMIRSWWAEARAAAADLAARTGADRA